MSTVELPAPLTPPECDLRGYDFMPLHGHRLFGSSFYGLARRNPQAGLAGIKLWWEAWTQCPAASLPDDDFDLAHFAGLGQDMAAWAAVKATALHGFIHCSDGRLYHPFLAAEAVKAFDMRLKSDRRRAADRARLQAWRDAQRQASPPQHETRFNPAGETPDETRFETPSETRFETCNVAREQDRDSDIHYAPQEARIEPPIGSVQMEPPVRKPRSSRGTRLPADWSPNGEYTEFARRGGLNPARVGAAFRDYWIGKAGKDACKADWLATWRNWCRRDRDWREPDPLAPEADSAARAATSRMRTASGRVLSDAELFEVAT